MKHFAFSGLKRKIKAISELGDCFHAYRYYFYSSFEMDALLGIPFALIVLMDTQVRIWSVSAMRRTWHAISFQCEKSHLPITHQMAALDDVSFPFNRRKIEWLNCLVFGYERKCGIRSIVLTFFRWDGSVRKVCQLVLNIKFHFVLEGDDSVASTMRLVWRRVWKCTGRICGVNGRSALWFGHCAGC